MSDATQTPDDDIEKMFHRPLTEPQTSDGIGPTLGEDLTAQHELEEDALYRHEHERRSFIANEEVLRGARSA